MNLEKIAENDSMSIFVDKDTVLWFGNKVSYGCILDFKEHYINLLKNANPESWIRSSYHFEGLDLAYQKQYFGRTISYSENMCKGKVISDSNFYDSRDIPSEALSRRTLEYFITDWTEKTAEECLPEYKSLAEQGNVLAQLSLAEIYIFGKDRVEINYELAAYWFTKAAEQGHPIAFNDLGNMYSYGLYYEKDQFKAIEFYRLGAMAGNKAAKMNYGKHLLKNATTSEQHQEGLNLLTQIADEGYIQGQLTLAMIYVDGKYGVEIDYEKSFQYFQLAASVEDLEGITGLGMSYAKGHGCEKNLERANHLFKHAADLGYAQAQFNLAWNYHYGLSGTKNHEEAFKYYLMAAEQNHPAGLRGLGEMFELESDESPEKLDMAIKLYHQAADLGDLIAEYNLGVFYQYGTGVEVNKKTSAMYLERAASKDHPSANLNLGLLYQEGVNGVPDYKKAMSYFNRAAELGNPKAEGCIAVLYQHGLGVDKNTEKAIELFTTCAERGLVHAQYNLSIILSEDDSKYKDIETAFYWLEKAANLDFAPAQKNLSIFLWGGKGSAVDFEEAVKWAFIARHNNEDKADDLINYYEKEIPHEAFIEGFERAKSYLADKD
jgi:hypothetical protein